MGLKEKISKAFRRESVLADVLAGRATGADDMMAGLATASLMSGRIALLNESMTLSQHISGVAAAAGAAIFANAEPAAGILAPGQDAGISALRARAEKMAGPVKTAGAWQEEITALLPDIDALAEKFERRLKEMESLYADRAKRKTYGAKNLKNIIAEARGDVEGARDLRRGAGLMASSLGEQGQIWSGAADELNKAADSIVAAAEAVGSGSAAPVKVMRKPLAMRRGA